MQDWTEAVLAYFAQGNLPLEPRELAKELKIPKSKWSPFRATIEQLLEAGKLRLDSLGQLQPRRSAVRFRGKIKRTASGAGYVKPAVDEPAPRPDQTDPVEPLLLEKTKRAGTSSLPQLFAADEKVYIAPEDMLGALTGDLIEVELLRRRRAGGQRVGRVVDILVRAKSTFVGVYHVAGGQALVTIDGGALDQPVLVGDPGAKGAKPDDKVVVEIVKFPTDVDPAEGVITHVLGAQSAPGVDTESIIHEFQLPDQFPEQVLEAARDVVRSFDENDLRDRLDLTGETIITIDPVDARDFDDAISLTKEGDHWRLGVHIADVSHFVQPGSAIDREAERRGTSVYLPTRVLPMLPEQLSNGLASLQQGHLRYTKSVFIHFDSDGRWTATEFANSAIRVVQRFAYEEVLPLIQNPYERRSKVSREVYDLLHRMHELAMLLRRRRFERGALDLQLPEVKLDFDEDGRVIGAHRVSHDESHQVIEEFMLAANVAVASKLSELGYPYLHRTHAAPDERKLRALGDFLKGLGFDVKPWAGREEIQRLLKSVAGLPSEEAISYAVLRSMKQAEYSPAEVGHFALAEDFYCHFTSPIRRYPDLLVHRLFDSLVRRGKKAKFPSEIQLARQGEHCSETERRAESAERELIKIKLLTYLKGKIGWEQTAVVTSVEKFGLFCLGVDLPADGMIHVRSLPADQYDFDPKSHTLVARRSGRMYRLGDRLRVQVARVDLHERTLDYRIVEDSKGKRRPAKLKKNGETKTRKPRSSSPRRKR